MFKSNASGSSLRVALGALTVAAVVVAQSPSVRTAPALTVENAVQVMTVADTATAYDFSVTDLGGNQNFALFHAESYWPSGCSNLDTAKGDSIAVRYGTTPDGYNAFGHHATHADLIIGRSTTADSEYQYQEDCNSVGGAANPTLFFFNNQTYWTIYYVGMRKEEGTWRHYLLNSLFTADHLANIHGAWMHHLKGADAPGVDDLAAPICSAGERCWPGNVYSPTYGPSGGLGPLVLRDLKKVRPVREGAYISSSPLSGRAEQRIRSEIGYSNPDDTHGLLGSIATDASYANIFYYYTDMTYEPGTSRPYKWRLFRRTAPVSGFNEFSAPVSSTLLATAGVIDSQNSNPPGAGEAWYNPKVKVNYSTCWSLNTSGGCVPAYVVLYNCWLATAGGQKPDVCLQTSSSPDLPGITLGVNDSATYGIGIPNDPAFGSLPRCAPGVSPCWDMNGQFNIRRNGWGHHFHDSYANGQRAGVVYFNACRSDVDGCDYFPGRGGTIYAKTIRLTQQ